MSKPSVPDPRRHKALQASLEALTVKYQEARALDADPLAIPLAFVDPMDREVAAWIAAHLAYGRVAPMQRAIRSLLGPLGPSPSTWLRAKDAAEIRRAMQAALPNWVWRFHTLEDMIAWILAWKRLDEGNGHQGMENDLLPGAGRSADEALSALVQRLRLELPATHGLRFSLPDPLEGAACKRWRMFLRWMVREAWPDLGLWRAYPREALVIPLDTHVARISRLIGLTSRATPDGRMALEITQALQALDPLDPLRFDFPLSHLGILGDCPGLRSLPGCAACPLVELCGASD